ncbi:MAG TPA: hypothetical protein VF503_16780 [Sphingobium sp.]|uniref:hypothetical protein n=1 Tax=Sphingobium sp. TaxID=1912891 RepID=UPI002ED31C68
MSFFRSTPSVPTFEESATIVHRSSTDITGVRKVIDEVSGVTVHAFPIAMVRDIVPARAMMTACYILAGNERLYIGESNRIGRRLCEHAADRSKAFAQDVFVITNEGAQPFDKPAVQFLQHHFSNAAEEARLMTVQKGTGAPVVDLARSGAAYLRHMVRISERLLFDAGCRAFHCTADRPQVVTDIEPDPASEIGAADLHAADETGPMEIGVGATPAGTAEYQLVYGGLWARGYPADGGFVVTAGSELRSDINASVNPILHTRRGELEGAGVLADIAGVAERRRLLVSVWFPSPAIAAKVITGAHVASNKWTAVRDPRPFVLAA